MFRRSFLDCVPNEDIWENWAFVSSHQQYLSGVNGAHSHVISRAYCGGLENLPLVVFSIALDAQVKHFYFFVFDTITAEYPKLLTNSAWGMTIPGLVHWRSLLIILLRDVVGVDGCEFFRISVFSSSQIDCIVFIRGDWKSTWINANRGQIALL